MEALMKEGGGGDHISVGMRIQRRIRLIPSTYLYMVPPGEKHGISNQENNPVCVLKAPGYGYVKNLVQF